MLITAHESVITTLLVEGPSDLLHPIDVAAVVGTPETRGETKEAAEMVVAALVIAGALEMIVTHATHDVAATMTGDSVIDERDHVRMMT